VRKYHFTAIFGSFKRKKPLKNQRFIKFIGWQGGSELEQKSAQIISMFVSHHEEILAMKEQVQMIRGLLAA
jgi:hypothetical protein